MISYFSSDYRPLRTFIGLGQQGTPQALEVDHHSVLSANPVPTLVIDDTVAEPEPTAASEDRPILANATFVMLCKNGELEGVISSVRQIEDRFNRFYRYPWVFLNDQPFTDEFKERVGVISDAPMHFGPDWIDEKKALAGRLKMVSQGIIYAASRYRNMCRFNSGFFYRHELMKPYRYYWRPNVQYFCDLKYDPFRFMQDNNKVYGFTISLLEWMQTIPTLWEATKEFVGLNYEYLHPENMLDFLSNDNGTHYNLCHFWSNFEIADMDFWRGEAYSKFFEYLESKGGFYYERWGDAPVHSIAVALFASKHQIHFFNDIGYKHESFQHCPAGQEWYDGHCSCNPRDTFITHPNSCTKRFISLFPDNTTAT
ncbi:glycosyltransferase family 15 protein [Coprinellus micaceus]|uniref:Glycosyltransferase family 15 protein n=1 Tax=Coprinellus micaceus TaxID=71717 RepID=A0A4Y7TCG0_COPMI|nr:glycosyltransferase family 15 protein [Coprinellus micaceus]